MSTGRTFARGLIKIALIAKEQRTARPYTKAGKTWTRTTGGKVAVNRLHDQLRALWNWAFEEQYTVVQPFIRTRKGKNRLKHDESSRSRRLREGEEAGLLKATTDKDGDPTHLHDCIVFALETGMRKGEILGLQWSDVRWMQNEIFLPAVKTKNRADRQIPMSATVREMLTRRQYGVTTGPNPTRFKFKRDDYVFGNGIGEQVKDIKTAWENAVLKAHGAAVQRTATFGLSASSQKALAAIDLHFHDLRHEAGSRKLEAGWPLHAVSLFLGHANVTTTARYLNVKADYLHELIERQPLTAVSR